MNKITTSLMVIAIGFISTLISLNANAVPAFARQTNMACSACHNSNFLALNSFGRQFKMQGYVLTTRSTVHKDASKAHPEQLSISELPGLNAMMQISTTQTRVGVSGQQNGAIRFPQQLSLFLAGRISDKMGMFSQFTYANGDSGFAIDNTDFRYADNTMINGKSLFYGFTLDNNPTVGDLWNSTPAWGFPYSGSDVTVGPAAGDFISSLGGAVAGTGAYGMFDNHFYGKFTLYRNTNINGAAGNTNVISGVAPYWRLAYQTDLSGGYLMVGTYGISANVRPLAMATNTGIGGPLGKYTDTAIDFQYEHYMSNDNSLVMHGSYTHESRTDVDANGAYLANNKSTWKFSKFDMEYNLRGQWRPGVSVFSTNTGADNLDSAGYAVDVSYFPWENVQLQALYTGYTKFDGSSNQAGNNNSVYLLLWIVL